MTYRVTVEISGMTTSDIQLRLGSSGTVDATITANGTYTYTLVSDGTRVYFFGSAGFDGSIESVSVREVISANAPVPGSACPHVLVEPQRTNLATYSEEFDNAAWVKTGTPTITANDTISPDGTSTADKVLRTITGPTYVGQTYTKAASALPYVFSIFAKKDSTNFVSLRLQGTYPARVDACFDLSTGTISLAALANTFTNEFADIEDYGNGWYRLTVGGTTDATTSAFSLISSASVSQQVDATDPIASASAYIWGAVLEAGAYPTSYIPTVASSVTRLADAGVGSGNSTTFNSEAGVLFVDMAALFDDGTNRRISISDGTNDNRIVISYDTANKIQCFFVIGGVSSATPSFVVDTTQMLKIAFRWALDDFSLWVSGTEQATDVSGSVFAASTLTTLSLSDGAGGSPFYGKIRTIQTFEYLDDNAMRELGSNYGSYTALSEDLGYNLILDI